jgi:hypothetical protein
MFLGNVNVTKESNAEKNIVHGVYLLHVLRKRNYDRRHAGPVGKANVEEHVTV